MKVVDLHDMIRKFVSDGIEALESTPIPPIPGLPIILIAVHDIRRDQVIQSVSGFQATVDCLAQTNEVRHQGNHDAASRWIVQLVLSTIGASAHNQSFDSAFELTWNSFLEEMSSTVWHYRDVANIQNLECQLDTIPLWDGLSVRGRNWSDLAIHLNWGDNEFSQMSQDWRDGAMSSHVLMAETDVLKSPDNVFTANGVDGRQKMSRLLLAMRLHASGDVGIGKVWHTRPTKFQIGMGGTMTSGSTSWNPGTIYKLESADLSAIKQLYDSIAVVEGSTDSRIRSLRLALNRFASIYERQLHRVDDRIVDAITALEAAWQVRGELSFRIAFRTASLLGTSDDERRNIYTTLRDYYDIRSRLVHGDHLTTAQSQKLNDLEPPRAIVRRTLRAFLFLAAHPGVWTLERVQSEADGILLHNTERVALQHAMGIGANN